MLSSMSCEIQLATRPHAGSLKFRDANMSSGMDRSPPCYRHTGPDPQVLASSLCSPSTLHVWDPHRPGTMFRVSTMTCVGLHRAQKISPRTKLFMESLLWKHLHPRHTFPPHNLTSLHLDVSLGHSQGRVALGASSSWWHR